MDAVADCSAPTPRAWTWRTRALVPLAVLALVAEVLVKGRFQLPPVAAAAPTGGPPLAYVGAGSSVEVIDVDANRSVANVPMEGVPSAIAITPDARYVLVALPPPPPVELPPPPPPIAPFIAPAQTPPAGRVRLIDVATNTVVAGVDAPVGPAPRAIAVKPDGTTAYVMSNDSVSSVTPLAIGPGASLTPDTPIAISREVITDGVVSPDGKTLFVLDVAFGVLPITLPSMQQQARIPIGGGNARRMVISPDGAHLYIAVGGALGSVVQVPVAGPKPTTIPLPLPNDNPVALAIAATATGVTTLYVADRENSELVKIPLPAAPGPATTAIDIPPPVDLAVTPDGSMLKVSTEAESTATVDAGAGKADTCEFAPSRAPCPRGGGPIAVTPDQRPTAAFTISPAPAGQETSFDASSSTITFGTITRYRWDFGDGTPPVDTNTPTTTHPYAAAGTYTVVLTVTDWAGASVDTSPPSTIFTGHTVTRRGGSPARTRNRVTIPPGESLPPTLPPTLPPSATPLITLDPELGPPGTVVAVSGTGFPGNTSVLLVWQRGIVGSATPTTDPDGSFRTSILVFPRDDQLGYRTLVAQGFPSATAEFLVQPPTVQPGGLDHKLLFRQ